MEVAAVGVGLSSARMSGKVSLVAMTQHIQICYVIPPPSLCLSSSLKETLEVPLLVQSQVSLGSQRRRYIYSWTYDGLS